MTSLHDCPSLRFAKNGSVRAINLKQLPYTWEHLIKKLNVFGCFFFFFLQIFYLVKKFI